MEKKRTEDLWGTLVTRCHYCDCSCCDWLYNIIAAVSFFFPLLHRKCTEIHFYLIFSGENYDYFILSNLFYGVFYKTWLIKASRIWNWDSTGQRDSIIGGPDTAIILWKPNKSLYQGSTSVGIHGQKILFTVCFWDFVDSF